jgi:hypothetical protein
MDIPDEVRPKHVYIPGKTQYGKSNLLLWMFIQDVVQGHGVCLMDGKGDLAPEALNFIPKRRIEDTVYLDTNTPVPLDFMDYKNNDEKEAIIGELKYVLTRTVETQHIPIIGANITDILYTLFNYNENPKTPDECRATFLDIYYFLEDEKRRTQILDLVTDQDLQRRWKDKFPNPTDRSRITTRMTPFVRSETLKKIFGAKKPKLNVAQFMEEEKVLVVNLGPMTDIRRIYGTLLLSKIRQTADRRASIPKSQRKRFYLYCDEFQEFQTSDFDTMLSRAGGLGLCLTLAHQFLAQLEPRILHSIKGNVSTYILFRLGDDAASFRSEIPPLATKPVWRRSPESGLMGWTYEPVPFDTSLLTKLSVGEALYRAADGSASLIHTPPPPTREGASSAGTIRRRTLEKYSCDIPQVCSTGEDGNRTPRPEGIAPGGAANVPSHGGKKKNA